MVAELGKIRAAIERHVPTVECIGHSQWPETDDILDGPSIVEPPDVAEDATFVGQHLSYRVVAYSDGAFGVIGGDADHHDPPRVLIQRETRWKSVVWFLWLLELNHVKSLWQPRPWHLKNETGKVVLSIA